MTIHELLQAAGLTANDEIPIWDVDGTGEPTKKITAQQLAAAVVALANLVTGVKGNAESSYRTGNVNITPANIGAKAVQSAVSDPTASGTAVAFIDSISQNAQGVISPTKKTVQSASQSAAGLMSAADKTKLDGIEAGAQVNSVTGVKGNSEQNYRNGNVNLTPANIGAVDKTGDTMTGNLYYKLPVVDASKADNNVSSALYPTTYCVLDKDNRILSRLESIVNPNGDISTYLYVSNYNTSGQKLANNGIMLTIDKAGNLTYTFSHPEKAREALGITGEEIPLLSNPLVINNGTLQYTASTNQSFHNYKFVDLYFVIQGSFTNAIRLCPDYYEKTYKFGFFAWNSDDSVLRKVAVAFTTAGRYLTDCVVRMAYSDNGAFNTTDNVLYLYKAIGYKW